MCTVIVCVYVRMSLGGGKCSLSALIWLSQKKKQKKTNKKNKKSCDIIVLPLQYNGTIIFKLNNLNN